MASYLISGASRGIGLGICAALAAKPASEVSIVFAAVRTETDAVKQLVSEFPDRVALVPMDAASEDSVRKAAGLVEESLDGKGLDVVMNVAGVMPFTPEGVQAMNDLDSVFNTNVTSAHLVTRTFLPLLKKGSLKKVINFSSTVGSIAWAPHFSQLPSPAYKISKAALNMLTAQYAETFANQGFTFITLSPGWVKTDLGSEHAHLDVETSVRATLDIVFGATRKDNGKFLNVRVPGFEDTSLPDKYEGGEIPW
ncbi:hypothetical protein ACJZ2D_004505 [Fusarium nematophilum]